MSLQDRCSGSHHAFAVLGRVVEMAYTVGLEPTAARLGGSNPPSPTMCPIDVVVMEMCDGEEESG